MSLLTRIRNSVSRRPDVPEGPTLRAVPDDDPIEEPTPVDTEEQTGPERRDSPRFRVGHRAHIVSWGRKYRVRIVDISHSGAAVTSRAHVRIGEKTILTVHDMGRYRGTAIRHIGDGVAIRFDENEPRPEIKGAPLRTMMNSLTPRAMTALARPPLEKRGFRRADMSNPASMITGGERITCSILNISAGGTAVCIDHKPDLDRWVILYIDYLGRMRGRVTRHFDDGIAIEFDVESTRRDRLEQQVSTLLSQASH